jgi:hypothetical protein
VLILSGEVLTVINQSLRCSCTLFKLFPIRNMVGKSFLDAGDSSIKSVGSLRLQALPQLWAKEAVFKPIKDYNFALLFT